MKTIKMKETVGMRKAGRIYGVTDRYAEVLEKGGLAEIKKEEKEEVETKELKDKVETKELKPKKAKVITKVLR